MEDETRMTRIAEHVTKKTPGAGLKDFERQINIARMRQYRLARTRAEMARRDLGACLLYDMANIHYATGMRNMSLFTGHYPTRYLFVAASGPVILFAAEAGPLRQWLPETVDELRPARNWYFELNGDKVAEAAQPWAAEIDDLMRTHCGGNRRLGVDRMGAMGFMPLHSRGIEICDGQASLEAARAIKSEDEIACISISI